MSYTDQGERNPWNPFTNITLGVILAMVIIGGSSVWYYHDVIFGSGRPSTSRLERELSLGAAMLNRRAPIQVDEITTLVGADAHGTHLNYRYTISRDIPAERLDEARQALERQIGATICSDPDMGPAVRNGAVITADYRDTSGDTIHVNFPNCGPSAG